MGPTVVAYASGCTAGGVFTIRYDVYAATGELHLMISGEGSYGSGRATYDKVARSVAW